MNETLRLKVQNQLKHLHKNTLNWFQTVNTNPNSITYRTTRRQTNLRSVESRTGLLADWSTRPQGICKNHGITILYLYIYFIYTLYRLNLTLTLTLTLSNIGSV